MSEKTTRDDIIRMAREAGFSLQESFVRTEFRHEKDGYAVQFCLEPLERFAHKVIEHFLATTDQYVTNDASREAAIKAAVAVEREECAIVAASTVCDEHIPTGIKIYGTRAARAIRARGEK